MKSAANNTQEFIMKTFQIFITTALLAASTSTFAGWGPFNNNNHYNNSGYNNNSNGNRWNDTWSNNAFNDFMGDMMVICPVIST